MGPLVSPWVAILPSRRWLLLLAIPLGAAIAALPPSPPAVPVLKPGSLRVGPDDELAAIARAHRGWVDDHGPGCARSIEHLVPYLDPDLDLAVVDSWGERLHFTCDRGPSQIVVEVTSAGLDRVLGTMDDQYGIDRDDLSR